MSILECIIATHANVDSRVRVKFDEGATEMTLVVRPRFPFRPLVGFELDVASVSPEFKKELVAYFEKLNAVSKHLAAVEHIVGDIKGREIILDTLGYSSYDKLVIAASEHRKVVEATKLPPLYAEGEYGSHVLTVDDIPVLSVTTPAGLPPFALPEICGLEALR